MVTKVYLPCKNCGKERWVRLEGMEPRSAFCSKHCYVDYKRKNQTGIIKSAWEIGKKGRCSYLWHSCVKCGKSRWVSYDVKNQTPRRLTCDSCARHRKGKEHGHWKGGRGKHPGGYILCYLKSDDFFYPMVSKAGYVLEHRLVMAKHLNRCLLQWEIVHHKNGVRDDNRLENLQLLPSQTIHNIDTQVKRYINQLKREILALKSENTLLKKQKGGASEIIK